MYGVVRIGSAYQPYPYLETDGRNRPRAGERIVVRGGWWEDRPQVARSGNRLSYPEWQRVYNLGFRVVIEASDAARLTRTPVIHASS